MTPDAPTTGGPPITSTERVARTGADPTAQRLEQLRGLFPEVFAEGRVDFGRLRRLLGDLADESPERFQFSWAGKRDAVALLQRPSAAALRPAPDESAGWDTAAHLMIEGDNLEALKLLHGPYWGQVKLIYIDPPYNTGKDFVYPDDYADSLGHYLRVTGQVDDRGNVLSNQRDQSGRFHSGWLSMMYPRLFLARQLLRDDGVIMVSIDDHEVHHLRLLMNELFGEENFIAQLVWDKTRKNDARLFSVGHEYVVVYARSKATLGDLGTVWRESKPGAREIMAFYRVLKARHGDDYAAMEAELRGWYRSLPADHPSKKLSRYRHIDRWGPWRDRDISWPGAGGKFYEVRHPVTGEPCAVPPSGWRFSTPEAMERQIRLGLVVFREDHTLPPIRKAHLMPVAEELGGEEDTDPDSGGGPGDGAGEGAGDGDAGLQVMPSYIYAQAQVSVKRLRALMGGDLFQNPKDPAVIARLVRYCTRPDGGDIILDFFAGSGTTGEAVMTVNQEDGGNRRFILVQLPQPTPPRSAAHAAGYATIADLTKERLRRCAAQLTAGGGEKRRQVGPGFRVFKLGPSSLRPWDPTTGPGASPSPELLAPAADPLVPGWKVADVLWEVALREGYPLGAVVTEERVGGNTVYRVEDQERGQHFALCVDDRLDPELITALELGQDDLFVCRDTALTDTLAANLALQCRLKVL